MTNPKFVLTEDHVRRIAVAGDLAKRTITKLHFDDGMVLVSLEDAHGVIDRFHADIMAIINRTKE